MHRYTLGVVYAAKEVDAHKDWMTSEDIEQAAWNYARKGMRIGVQHRAGTTGAGTVVESYIHRGAPWRVNDIAGEQQVVEPGDWILGVVWTPEAWAEIQSGRVTGYSLQGWASKAIESAARERIARKEKLMPILGGSDRVRKEAAPLAPEILEAINGAIREALKQALPHLADELQGRFRRDVDEIRRALDGQRVERAAPAGLTHSRLPSLIHWGPGPLARR
jgi:hypothetical protein